MRCPKCGSDRSSVVDSRGEARAIRRRRECQDCGFRFTTFERVEVSLPLVVKKDGRREQFIMEKLEAGVLRACEKRPVSTEDIEGMLGKIEQRVQEQCLKEIPSVKIGDLLMEELKLLDHIAYVRFASVYREFTDIGQFVDTLQSLTTDSAKDALKKKSGNLGAAQIQKEVVDFEGQNMARNPVSSDCEIDHGESGDLESNDPESKELVQ